MFVCCLFWTGVRFSPAPPLTSLFELLYMNQSFLIDFFVYQKNHRKDLSMVNIIKEEIEIEESLEARLRVICNFVSSDR